MLKPEDLRVEVIRKPMIVEVFPRNEFVKITHLPSGISVTKHNNSQLKARNEALEELEVLVEIYNGEDDK